MSYLDDVAEAVTWVEDQIAGIRRVSYPANFGVKVETRKMTNREILYEVPTPDSNGNVAMIRR